MRPYTHTVLVAGIDTGEISPHPPPNSEQNFLGDSYIPSSLSLEKNPVSIPEWVLSNPNFRTIALLAYLTTSCKLFLKTPSSFSDGNPMATMLGLMSESDGGEEKERTGGGGGGGEGWSL